MNIPELTQVQQTMRDDWNARAREDANYYVAFGRRGQPLEEFLSTATDVIRGLVRQLQYLPPTSRPRTRRALEIGCGPGRLMLPISRYFGEIHGVDVSDEMISRARENLSGVPHAHPHVGSGSDLAQFADESFDYVYSYAVFQHIPSHDCIWSYLREANRVVKPGGILRCQLNGLRKRPNEIDTTWSGASFTPAMLRGFARESGLELLSAEGAGTQYLWTTLRKPAPAAQPVAGPVAIRRVTNVVSSEPCSPAAGRFAFASLCVDGLPYGSDLNTLEVRFRGQAGEITFIGPPERDGLVQVNALLPPGLVSGYAPVELFYEGRLLAPSASLRILPVPIAVPALLNVTDGVDLCAGSTISSGTVKAVLEEAADISLLDATINGLPIHEIEFFLVDPQMPRYEINFKLPEGLPPGPAELLVQLGRRRFPPVSLHIAAAQA